MSNTAETPVDMTHAAAKGPIEGEIVLSTEAFYESVWAIEPKLAVFDCDGTLWSPDAGGGFMRWSIETGLLSPAAVEQITYRHGLYNQGIVDEETICGEMTSIYAGIPEADIRASARTYFEKHIQPHIFPEMVSLIEEMQTSDVEIWAVSSTNNWMIEEALRDLGITHEKILAACVEVVDGVVTDKIINVPTGPGKARSLKALEMHQPDVVFGNSVHDVAMLEIAKRPFPVNPSQELQRLCVDRNWAVYYPAAIRPR